MANPPAPVPSGAPTPPASGAPTPPASGAPTPPASGPPTPPASGPPTPPASGPPAPIPFRRVGELQGVSDVSGWLTIDREHLAGFAFSTYLTADDLGRSLPDSPTHDLVDGFLLLSLVAHADLARPFLDPAATYAYNYGVDRVRFTRPVHVGEEVRVSRTVTGVRLKTPTRALVTCEGTVDVARADRPAMAATWLVLQVDAVAEAAQREAGQ